MLRLTIVGPGCYDYTVDLPQVVIPVITGRDHRIVAFHIHDADLVLVRQYGLNIAMWVTD